MTDKTLEAVAELKPCPYVNTPLSKNEDISFVLKSYPTYSDFILFDNGKPERCFRFAAHDSDIKKSMQVWIDYHNERADKVEAQNLELKKHIRVLVEALIDIENLHLQHNCGITSSKAKQALASLPEELRGL